MSNPPDFLSMSDEDFLEQSPASGELEADTPVVEEVVAEPAAAAEDVGVTQAEEPVVVETEPKKVKEPKAKPEATVAKAEVTTPKTGTVPDAEDDEPSEAEESEAEVETASTDYEAFYKQIMTPFTANGRTVELKTPDEEIQLMQMGANYTKKMQELVPHRKMLKMLENNGLLDEGKLSFLIDVEKKNPEAIKKLLKDSGVDPMEIDTTVEPAYREGNHRVSDEEVAFHSTLEDMKSTPERLGTLQVINGDWDQASKEALWKNPEIMTLIHGQRETGVYDRINTEVERRRTLGAIPANIPFLQAYKVVGDEMTAKGSFADLVQATPSGKQEASPIVATRVAAPKAAVANGKRAAAASTNRSTSAAGKGPSKNPLEMSDDDFLKLDQFAGRV